MSLVEVLAWDSEFFGVPIGRVAPGITAARIGSAIDEAEHNDLRCIYLLVPSGDQALIDAAQDRGFIARGLRVELERPVKGHPVGFTGVRAGEPGDLPQLEELARARFRGTRFFADERFPADRSAEMYVEWLRRGFAPTPERVVLVTDDRSGFSVCHINTQTHVGSVELIAVTAEATGRRLGDRLMAGAGTIFAEASLDTARVVTQGHNIGAQNLYRRHGYRTSETSLWLHRWLGPDDSPAPDVTS